MREGDIIGGLFRICERVGLGGFATVYRAEEIHGGRASVALKAFNTDLDNDDEMQLLASLDHPHILRYRTTVAHDGRLCLVTDFGDGGDASDLLNVFPTGVPHEQVVVVIRAVAEALEYLHAQDIAHRDVKPSNILFVSGAVKLGDIGLAKVLSSTMSRHSGAQSPAYAAPEMLMGRVALKSDLYSLGVTAYELLTGSLPFDGMPAEVMMAHMSAQPNLAKVPAPWRALVGSLLEKEPTDRPDASQVREAVRGLTVSATQVPPSVHANGRSEPSPNHLCLPAQALVIQAWDWIQAPDGNWNRDFFWFEFPDEVAQALEAAAKRSEKVVEAEDYYAFLKAKSRSHQEAVSRMTLDTVLDFAVIDGIAEQIREIHVYEPLLINGHKFRQKYVVKLPKEILWTIAETFHVDESWRNFRADLVAYVTDYYRYLRDQSTSFDEAMNKANLQTLHAFNSKQGVIFHTYFYAPHQHGSQAESGGGLTLGYAKLSELESANTSNREVSELHVGKMGELAAIVGGNTLELWSLDTQVRRKEVWLAAGVKRIAPLDGFRLIVVADDSGKLFTFDVETESRVTEWSVDIDPFFALSMDVDRSKSLVAIGNGNYVHLLRASTGKVLMKLHADSRSVDDVRLSPSGHIIASIGLEKCIRLWDARTGTPLNIFRFSETLSGLAFVSDNYLAFANTKGKVCVFDLNNGRLVRRFDHDGNVHLLAVSPDQRFIASAGASQSIKIWCLRTGKLYKSFEGHQLTIKGYVETLSFSEDGFRLVSGGADGIIRVWDVTS